MLLRRFGYVGHDDDDDSGGNDDNDDGDGDDVGNGDGGEDDVGGLFWAGTSTVPEEETGGRQLEARRNLSGHRETDPDENHELSCG